eukprot:CAMPEP_0170546064 /NCGR_PEP_ID=MMETSP0211-20121228/4427_1 /TAXON_ID=311385 /ORGANISM="Pseudokeronopsis sp., Strain OXSARD2" /LENGTH=82 /DNA_ID=CAMNT_0010850315 /DNA_START=611 /DNA_END=859 /DNA_ORIENTATION=+
MKYLQLKEKEAENHERGRVVRTKDVDAFLRCEDEEGFYQEWKKQNEEEEDDEEIEWAEEEDLVPPMEDKGGGEDLPMKEVSQ